MNQFRFQTYMLDILDIFKLVTVAQRTNRFFGLLSMLKVYYQNDQIENICFKNSLKMCSSCIYPSLIQQILLTFWRQNCTRLRLGVVTLVDTDTARGQVSQSWLPPHSGVSAVTSECVQSSLHAAAQEEELSGHSDQEAARCSVLIPKQTLQCRVVDF